MIEHTLYKREMKRSIKLLIFFAAVLTMYIAIILSMYDPKTMAGLETFFKIMPQLMAAVGMTGGELSLIGFMISYLYGFIFLIFPMVFCILRGNGLIAKYTDNGSMVTLLAAPVRRGKVVFTQMMVLITGIILLMVYSTVLEIILINIQHPGELVVSELLRLNLGLLCLHLFIGAICFLASCVFSEAKYSLAIGAGIPVVMYIIQMLANMGKRADVCKYFTFFTLFDPKGLAAGNVGAAGFAAVLAIGAVILYGCAAVVFCKKDLHI